MSAWLDGCMSERVAVDVRIVFVLTRGAARKHKASIKHNIGSICVIGVAYQSA